ncbi:MAG: rhamnogalacturonan lyase [Siphoviridae sp. ctjeG17]|nr:MAG: rhamnogalacturonan lyase [Siphoviridae sp. ctjeG17]
MRLNYYVVIILIVISSFSVLGGNFIQDKEKTKFSDDKGNITLELLDIDSLKNDKYQLNIIENSNAKIQWGFNFDIKTNDIKIKISSTNDLEHLDSYRFGYSINNTDLYQIISFNDFVDKNKNGLFTIEKGFDYYILTALNITDYDPVIYRDFLTNVAGGAGLYINTSSYVPRYQAVALNNITLLQFNISANSTKDMSINLLNGSSVGTQTPTYFSGKGLRGGGVWQFDGSNDKITIPYRNGNNTLNLNASYPYTFLFVYNASSSQSSNAHLLRSRTASNNGYIIRFFNYNFCWITSSTGTSQELCTSGINVTDDKYHTYALSYYPNHSKHVYVDNVLRGTQESTQNYNISLTNVTIGDLDGTVPIKGELESLAIIRQGYSVEEIQAWNSSSFFVNDFLQGGSYSIPFNNSANRTTWKNVSVTCQIGDNQRLLTACNNTLIVNVSYSFAYPTGLKSEIATFYAQDGNTLIYNITGGDYFFANVTVSNLSVPNGSQTKFLTNITAWYEPNKNIYVSTTGSDTNAGTFEYPYLTISKAYNSSSSFDVINIGSGRFDETIWSSSAMTISKANLTFIGNGTNRTVISVQSPTISYGFLLNVDGTKLYNFTLDGDSRRLYAGSDYVGVCVAINNNKNNTVIDGLNLQNCSTSAILADPTTNSKQRNISIINSYFWNNTGTNVIDLVNGGQQDLNISYNVFELSFSSTQIGIAEDTGGQGANNNGSGLYIGYNNFTTYRGIPSYYSTAIYLDTNWTRGFQGAQIENNNFGDATRGFYGLALRTREMNALNFTNNNIYINNSVGRNVVHLEAQNENITVAGNKFCLTGSPCNNSGSGTFVLSESSSYLTVANNTGIFSDVDDIYWAYSELTNTTNIRMENNNINMTMRTNTAHMVGIGEEGSSSNETYYGVITNNTIYIPTTGNYAEHSVFLGYCWYCNVSFNRVIGGEYGLASKGNRESNLWNNTLINQTLVSIYDKWGNYTIYENNTILSQINGINVIQISTGGGNSKNINFTRNNINISLTDNTTTGLYQDTTSHNLYSNYNIWHFPYYEFNQSFKNGSTYMNWTVWNVTNGQDAQSTFYPAFVASASDVTSPLVFNLSPVNGSSYFVTALINLSANVTDDTAVSFTYVNITFPNGTLQQSTLLQWLGNNHRFNFSSPNLTGQFNVSWFANDTSNNINASQRSYFILNATPDLDTPKIFNIAPLNQSSFEVLSIINISSNITDDYGLDIKYVNITFPNGTLQQSTLLQWIGNNHRFNFSSPNLTGQYNLSFYTNDTTGNINVTQDYFFNLTAAPVIITPPSSGGSASGVSHRGGDAKLQCEDGFVLINNYCVPEASQITIAQDTKNLTTMQEVKTLFADLRDANVTSFEEAKQVITDFSHSDLKKGKIVVLSLLALGLIAVLAIVFKKNNEDGDE